VDFAQELREFQREYDGPKRIGGVANPAKDRNTA
jgi:hypothetical protein